VLPGVSYPVSMRAAFPQESYFPFVGSVHLAALFPFPRTFSQSNARHLYDRLPTPMNRSAHVVNTNTFIATSLSLSHTHTHTPTGLHPSPVFLDWLGLLLRTPVPVHSDRDTCRTKRPSLCSQDSELGGHFSAGCEVEAGRLETQSPFMLPYGVCCES